MIQISISDGNPIKVTVDHRPNERRNSAIGVAAEACAEALRELIANPEKVSPDGVKQALIAALSPKVQDAEAPAADGTPAPSDAPSGPAGDAEGEGGTQVPIPSDTAPASTDATTDPDLGGANSEAAPAEAPAEAPDASKPAAE